MVDLSLLACKTDSIKRNCRKIADLFLSSTTISVMNFFPCSLNLPFFVFQGDASLIPQNAVDLWNIHVGGPKHVKTNGKIRHLFVEGCR